MFWAILCGLLMGVPLALISAISIIGNLFIVLLIGGAIEVISSIGLLALAADTRNKNLTAFVYTYNIMLMWGIAAGFLIPHIF